MVMVVSAHALLLLHCRSAAHAFVNRCWRPREHGESGGVFLFVTWEVATEKFMPSYTPPKDADREMKAMKTSAG